MIDRRFTGKNYGSMIEDIYPFLTKLFCCYSFNVNEWPEINLKVVLSGQIKIWGFAVGRFWLGYQYFLDFQSAHF